MSAAIPPLPNTPSWHGAELKHRDNFTFILNHLHEVVRRKRLVLWSNDWIFHYDNSPAHKAFSVKQFLIQKSITEKEHPPCSPDLAPNDFWLFPIINSDLQKLRFQDI
jgi:hypothetical protein